MQQEEDRPAAIRRELVERLRAMEGDRSEAGFAELAYLRAKETLGDALDEARAIRLKAIDDAKSTREHELTALLEQMRSLRESTESKIKEMLRAAEIEAERVRSRANEESETLLDQARAEASRIRAEATGMRETADQRASEAERLEAQLDAVLSRIAERLGIGERPPEGWLKGIFKHTK